MNSPHLRQRKIDHLGMIYASKSGRFYLESEPTKTASNVGSTAASNEEFLTKNGFLFNDKDRLEAISHSYQVRARDTLSTSLDYVILVPTLRCNLSCSYCQVSRVNVDQSGYDWSDDTLEKVLGFIDTLVSDSIKVEFQGGEPTLRIDLLQAVIARCERFAFKQFVICTNLSRLDDDLLLLLENPNVLISTSLDGDQMVHARQRTQSDNETDSFFQNLRRVIEICGADRVSALPTIDQTNPPEIDSLIDAYTGYGFDSLYLRPINFQGFARKRHPASKDDHSDWWNYYDSFIGSIIERNFADRSRVLEESYLSLCLKRIFRIGLDRHVDLRNPNPVGVDYLLIDYDGSIYPTDEARMLTRSGVVDLKLGSLSGGLDEQKRKMLDQHSTTHGDPACDSCIYQPFCGRDLIDDLSRYGRIDLPRHDTFFCQKHLHLFDFCMSLIYSNDPKVEYSLAKWMGIAGDSFPAQARIS
jgi:His-Xaa-Ser system radical SAM maturase HxsB